MRSTTIALIIFALAIPSYFLYPPLAGFLILLGIAVLLVGLKMPKIKRKRPIGIVVYTPEGLRVNVKGALREFEPIGAVKPGDKVKILEIRGSKLIVRPILKSRPKKE